MSGAEAILVLGLIANIAAVIDFTCKATARIKEAKQNANELPKAFRDIQITLPLLENALQKTRKRIESGNLDEDDCKAVQPVLRECTAKMNELNVIFEDCRLDDDSSKLMREWKAMWSTRLDKKVEEIADWIWRYIPLLTLYHITTPAASNSSLLTARLSEMSLTARERPKSHFLVPAQW